MKVNKKYFDLLYSPQAEKQLSKLQDIISDFLYILDASDVYNIGIKIECTPDNEKLTLYRNELLFIQNKILEMPHKMRGMIRTSLTEYRNYYTTGDFKSHLSKLNFEKQEEYNRDWVNLFIRIFATSEYNSKGEPVYLLFDYESIDTVKLFEENPNWIFDTETYIPLQNINILVECLVLIAHFHFIFDAYHLALNNFESSYEKNRFKIKDQKATTIRFVSDLTEDQFKYLYKEFTQTYNLIDDLKTDKLAFLMVFTSNFNDHNHKIYFCVDTKIVAYMLYKLKPHFSYLFKCIELSKKFISKENNIISSNNISSQLSKTVYQKIEVEEQDLIDKIINNIPNKEHQLQ